MMFTLWVGKWRVAKVPTLLVGLPLEAGSLCGTVLPKTKAPMRPGQAVLLDFAERSFL